MRAELGIELAFPERNGAQRQRRLIEAGATREEVFAASVAETRETYSAGGEGVSTDPTGAAGGSGAAPGAARSRAKRSCARPTRPN